MTEFTWGLIVGAGAGTVEGGLYGAGVSEEGERMEGAKQGAFWGSIMGAGLGPTLGWFTDAIAGKLSSKVGQKGDEMIDVIKSCLKDKSTYMARSKSARSVAERRWLELDANNDKYVELLRHPYKHPERKHINSLAENQ